jgi:hypothetical protein
MVKSLTVTGDSMAKRQIFPFTAIVGQERMLRGLTLNAVDPRIGGVLIRGERGTAKSTAARALAALLPEVKVVKDCRFGCDPDSPATWCTECQERAEKSNGILPNEMKPTPFVDLPISATEDRVVGTLDIEKAIRKGERAFEPGVLAAANRGLLYIDEVNLLDDHVVDILLDSAAMGMNIVEREGISFRHPARFILVGTLKRAICGLSFWIGLPFRLKFAVSWINATASRLCAETWPLKMTPWLSSTPGSPKKKRSPLRLIPRENWLIVLPTPRGTYSSSLISPPQWKWMAIALTWLF